MRRATEHTMGLALVCWAGCVASTAAAQAASYPRMAAISEYQMERTAEIQLARSAAPISISGAATILALAPRGYETAVEGTNGFVCLVDRGWMAAFDWPEFWNPKIRAAECLNPQAARAMLPLIALRSRLVMDGNSKAEVLSAIKAAIAKKELPRLESGAMVYMMSKAAYLTDSGQNAPHLMFLTEGVNGADWGSGMEGAPVMAAPYWFFTPQAAATTNGLPPIVVFLVGVTTWSDGTPAAVHRE